MNGLHLCVDCGQAFEHDALNWNNRAGIGNCDACTLQKYALRACYVICRGCGQMFEPDLTEQYLLTGTATCTACASSTAS
jgi:hypothetical protein